MVQPSDVCASLDQYSRVAGREGAPKLTSKSDSNVLRVHNPSGDNLLMLCEL